MEKKLENPPAFPVKEEHYTRYKVSESKPMKQIEKILYKTLSLCKSKDGVIGIYREEAAREIYLWHLEALKEEKEREVERLNNPYNESHIYKAQCELQSIKNQIKEVKGE